jgi:hypothetical protein
MEGVDAQLKEEVLLTRKRIPKKNAMHGMGLREIAVNHLTGKRLYSLSETFTPDRRKLGRLASRAWENHFWKYVGG